MSNPPNSYWHNELCGNRSNPPMRNGERSLPTHKEACGQSKEPKPKSCPKTYMRVMSKEVNWCWKFGRGGEEIKQIGKWIPKATWTSYNFENTYTWQTFLSNTFCKKEEVKEANPNNMPKTLIPFKWQQKSTWGKKSRGKPKTIKLCGCKVRPQAPQKPINKHNDQKQKEWQRQGQWCEYH
jgi:hypothetical protein